MRKHFAKNFFQQKCRLRFARNKTKATSNDFVKDISQVSLKASNKLHVFVPMI